MISFGSTPLYDVKLRKGDSLVAARFSRLDPKDKEDRRAVKAMFKNLSEQKDPYGKAIADDFLNKRPYLPCYAIETVGSKPLKDRITCLMTTNSEDSIKQNSELEIKSMSTNKVVTQTENIKGSGRAMLYGAVKIAKEAQARVLTLFSTNDDFYEHLALSKVTYRAHEYDKDYYINKQDYDSFLGTVGEKYQY